jgi:hypothetical protein
MKRREVLPIDRMFGSSAAVRGCPCGAKRFDGDKRPSASVVLQLASIGLPVRLRGRAVTIHCCEECIRLIHCKRGRKLARALAEAVQAQLVDIKRQEKKTHAA